MKPFARTSILTTGMFAVCMAGAVFLGQVPADAPAARGGDAQELYRRMGIRNATVHDPSTIVKDKDTYWVFFTGGNVPAYSSKDLINWTRAGPTLPGTANWIRQEVPTFGGNGFWAPDIIRVNDKFLLFYAASAFGLNTSTIGVATSPTLDRTDPAYKWTDGGKVVTSHQDDDFNCIDPAALLDTDGRLWLTFGSFWSGIKLIELDPKTGLRISPDSPMYSLAHWDSIEASYLYKHDNYYYLFVDLGMCCRGANSTYNMRLGRSTKVTGPYVDKEGKDMLLGGGTPFMQSVGPLIGPGHAGIIQVGDKYFLSCHYENTGGNGTLGIRPLTWSADGWPVLGDAQ